MLRLSLGQTPGATGALGTRVQGAVFSTALALLGVFAGFATDTVAVAQTQFSTVVRVNDRAITAYELSQRQLLLDTLGAPGNTAEQAFEGLIDDRLRLEAAEEFDVVVTEDEILAAMDEYAARSNLALDDFLIALGESGVDTETLYDFVRAGLLWREVIGGRFAGRVNISEEEIDRAITQATQRGGVRVLLSEIVLPLAPGIEDENLALAQEFSSTLGGQAEFEQTARRFSAAESRTNGGQIDWVSLSDLPPQVSSMLLGMSPGEISQPIPTQGAVILFLLRSIAEEPSRGAGTATVDFLSIQLPADIAPARVGRLQAQADSCDHALGLTSDIPENRIQRQSVSPSEIANDVAIALAQLDPGESSAIVPRQGGQEVLFLMVCGRVAETSEDLPRETVRNRLRQGQLQSYAESYLAQLRADAIIVREQ
ncbi:MAG: peptidylprolyl isomerase [Pseudomonadota bacterium]